MNRWTIHICIAMAAVRGAIAETRPTFEVASVKRNVTNGRTDFKPYISGDRVEMHNTQVGAIFNYAYRVQYDYQVAGSLNLPVGWTWYDVAAKVEGSPSDVDLRLMFQALLEDRFKLKVHREMREMAVYDLAVAKGGPKLAAAKEDSILTVDGKAIPNHAHGVFPGVDGAHLMGKGATMDELVEGLEEAIRGPVVDRTGLRGTYDYNVVFARENRPDDSGPSLPAAIRNEFGLQLERGKGMVEVIVIDHIERPSEN